MESKNVFQDRNLQCVECGQDFVFSADDQQYHSERGYSDPKRCPTCRRARRASQGSGGGYGGGGGGGYGGGGGGGGGGGYRSDRPMHTTTCAQCGQEAHVPFQPRGDRPVYCDTCYSQQRRERSW